MKKKIAYFISSKGIGATYHLCELANELTTLGSNQYIFLSDSKEQTRGCLSKLESNKVNLALFNNLEQNKGRIKASINCIKYLIKLKPNIIHTQSNFHLMLATIASIIIKTKIFHTIHSFNNGRGGWRMHINRLYLLLFCHCFVKDVFSPSNFVLNSFPTLKKKLHLLHLGYKSSYIKITEKKINTPLKIVYCAKFHPAKNHKWLIESLKDEIEKNKVNLLLPGDGSEYQNILNLINSSNKLNENIDLPGWIEQDEITKIYQHSDIAVIPSDSETFGYNIIEPLSYAIPVISFPVGVAKDLSDNKAITCIDFFDKEALKNKINYLISNPSEYTKLSSQAKEIFDKKFSWEKHIINYEKRLAEC